MEGRSHISLRLHTIITFSSDPSWSFITPHCWSSAIPWTATYKVTNESVSTVLFAYRLFPNEHHILIYSVSHWAIVLSPQMSCVQTWWSSLIVLSPTAPVMVLKKFQVCAKCSFLSGATCSTGGTFQPQSQLFTFESISYIPTFSFFTSKDTASGHTCINAKIRWKESFIHSSFLSVWFETELVLFMTWKWLLVWYIHFLSCFRLPL